MTENMRAFGKMVNNSPELQKKLGELRALPEEEVAAKLIALARESGIELSAEDVRGPQGGVEAPSGVELSDEQMGQVAGGADVKWGTDGITYDYSEFKYEFDMNRMVWVSWYCGIRHFRGKIVGRHIYTWHEVGTRGRKARDGYRPYYSVKYDDGGYEESVPQERMAYA